MKQIALISGKGGTGKTTLVAMLSQMVEQKILADCDVDAPNLHLLLPSQRLAAKAYYGSVKAEIDPATCSACGACQTVCRFQAIEKSAGKFTVAPLRCEGCAACTVVCPSSAIALTPDKTGDTYLDRSDRGIFASALLSIGAEGSGKLVTEIRKSLVPYQVGADYLLIDGPPGIGCVVIAAITGAQAVVAIAEPTPSGRHDLMRVLSVAEHFQIPAFVCINKYDLNLEQTQAIMEESALRHAPVIGQIPFDPAVVTALQHGKSPNDAGILPIVEAVEQLWQNLVRYLEVTR